MQYLEGETLAARLARGPLPLDRALKHAIEIADALDAAHRQGIVHRDLKPANVMLTKTGVKLLDFGIAKLRDPAAGSSGDDAEPPTVTDLTTPQAVLGTLSYMAPEQIGGKSVDARADIFAFGAVLYEMATGDRAFHGPSRTAVIAAILESNPSPVSSRQALAPPAFDRLVKKCLEKDPDERWQTARDLASELRWIASERPPVTTPPTSRRVWPAVAMALGLATVIVGGLAWWALTRRVAAPPQDVVRFTVPLAADESFAMAAGLPSVVAVSPDGSQIVYAARGSDGDRLYLRRRHDPVPVALAGTEGAIGPFFSPDGRWIGFASGGALKKMPLDGGAPQTLAEAPTFVGGSWGPDDTIVYGPQWRGPLAAVSARGGAARQITTLDHTDEIGHHSPHVLPDGSAVLFAIQVRGGNSIGAGAARVDVVELATGRRRFLINGQNPFYLTSGHLAFARADAVFAAPFDAKRLELTGSAVRMVDGVALYNIATNFAVSRDGTLVYVPSVGGDRQLVWVDRRGQSRPLSDHRGRFSHPRISPDGSRIVFQAGAEFWIHHIGSGTRTRLRPRGIRPIWTRDGRSITYNFEGRLYSAPVDESSEPQLVVSAEPEFLFPLAWSRDGHTLAYSFPVAETAHDVWVLPAGGQPRPFLKTPRVELAAMFSPDGRWMVYSAKEAGREAEVYVQPYPGPGGRVTVSRGGGVEPVWSPTGREIFYRSVNGRRILAVEVQSQPTFSAGVPQVLFEGHYPITDSFWSNYDVTADGHQFLMVAGPESAPPGLQVVINWMKDLKQRVPTR
jgi:serine/threonine-protein kinase